MFDFIKTFHKDEDGAVTVDWVVLTAAIVGIAVTLMATVETGISNLGTKINTELSTNVAVDGTGS